MTTPDLSKLSAGELFDRLRDPAPSDRKIEDRTRKDRELDAWALRLAGRLTLDEAEAAGWPLSSSARRLAEEQLEAGTSELEKLGWELP